MKSLVPVNLAGEQRKSKNPWEAKLWNFLRNRNFYGFKFKRQISIGKYIYDFVCDEKRFIIELDGGQHTDAEVKVEDQEKESYAISQGYKVLRFQNIDIDNNMEGVLEKLRLTIL